jgi:WD40 repeat protein
MFLRLRKILVAAGVLLLAGTVAFLHYGVAYRYAHVPLRAATLPQLLPRVGQAADGIVFSRDGKTLIITDAQLGLIQWSVPNLRCESHTQERVGAGISTTSLSPDGSILTVAATSEIHQWAVNQAGFTALAIQQYKFKHAALVEGYNSAYWDSFPLHLVSPSGKLAGGVDMDGNIIITKTDTGRQLFLRGILSSDEKDHPTQVCDIAFSPDDRLMAVSSFIGGIDVARAPLDITLYDVHTEKLLRHWQWKDAETSNVIGGGGENTGNLGTTGLVFSPDGLYLACADASRAAIWETRTGKLHQTLAPIGISWISRKRLLFFQGGAYLTGCGWGDHVPIWSVHTGRLLQTFYANSFTEAVAVSPDGRLLATGGQDAGFYVSSATGKQVSPDSRRRLAGQQAEIINGSIALWDISRFRQ